MLEELASDYAAYMKLNVSGELKTVQDVIDNMLTRLEELTSVLHMIKSKNSDCATTVAEDISKYRSEVTILCKKINTLNDVIAKMQTNVDVLEKQVEKAEAKFGVNNEGKIMSFLKPFMKRPRDLPRANSTVSTTASSQFESVLGNFTTNE